MTTTNIVALFLSAADCAQGREPEIDYANLQKYDGYWMAQVIKSRQPLVWEMLQSDQRDRLYGYYVSSFTTMATTSKSYLNLMEAQSHPNWLLTDGINYLRWSDDPANQFYNRYFLDIGNPEFQTWAADYWLKTLQEAGQKYLVADNVLLDVWSYWKTRTYPGWTYAGREKEWRENFYEYLGVVKAKLNSDGRYLIINHTEDYGTNLRDTEWSRLRAVCDGMADECVLGTPNKIWGGSQYEYALRNHDKNTAAGKWDWWLYYPNADVTTAQKYFLYAYASFLLCKADLSLFSDSVNAWHPEYNLELGLPLRTRHRVNYIWVREFERGIVAVNPTPDKRTVTVELDSFADAVTGNTGKRYIKLTMHPTSGFVGEYE